MDELAALGNLHFLRPAWFLLFIPYSLLSVVQWRRRDLGRQWRPVIAPHLLPRMIVPGSQRRLFSPLWVSTIMSPLLVIALAGPSWSRGESPFAEDSAALVIAIDLSESMAGGDLQPSRLQRARGKILEIAAARGDAYTAVVAYAGTGHTVLPLTNDSQVLLHYLDALQVGMLPRRGKAPESILPLAETLLDDRAGGTLLIVGDGAPGSSADSFKALRERDEIQLLVWGMGKNQDQMDEDAQRGLVANALPLQESELQDLAAAGGGYYRRVSTDNQDVDALLRRIDRHFQLSEDSSRPWIDGGYYFLPPLMLMFLLWFRTGWVLRW